MLSILRPKLRTQAAIEGIAIGLLLGLMDVHSTGGDWFNAMTAYLAAGFLLGLRHAGRAWQAWLPLGSSLYVMHRAAIGFGYQPPYVEVDAESAAACLTASWPAGLGLGVGAFVRFVISFLSQVKEPGEEEARLGRPGNGVPERADNPDRRGPSSGQSTSMATERRAARPFTVQRLTVMIAVVALHLAFARLLLSNDPLFGFCTFYSERYSESRFNTLRVGMTRKEVEAIVGPPLRKVPWNESAGPPHEEMWQYSDRRDYTANYWRRWVLFENDKVLEIISDFWFD